MTNGCGGQRVMKKDQHQGLTKGHGGRRCNEECWR